MLFFVNIHFTLFFFDICLCYFYGLDNFFGLNNLYGLDDFYG